MVKENKPAEYLYLDPDYKRFAFEVWKKCMDEGWVSQDAREYADMLWNEFKIKI